MKAVTASPRWLRPRLFGASSYTVLGCAGIALAYAVMLARGVLLGLPPELPGAALILGLCAFLAGVAVSKRRLGNERLVMWRQMASISTASGLTFMAWGEPFMMGFDFGLLGVGAFTILGRAGCTMVGCCHGRPSRFGLRYGTSHAEHGFSRIYVGTRLFPTQAALGVTLVLLVAATVAHPDRAGTVTGIFVGGYGVARFVIEWFRGDTERPERLHLSEAQWFSLAGSAWSVWLLGPSGLVFLGLVVASALVHVVLWRRGAWLDPQEEKRLHAFVTAAERLPVGTERTLEVGGVHVRAGRDPSGAVHTELDGDLPPASRRIWEARLARHAAARRSDGIATPACVGAPETPPRQAPDRTSLSQALGRFR